MRKLLTMSLGITILLELTLVAQQTETTVTFEDVPAHAEGENYYSTDKHGNSYYDRTATITTKNFKVKNFWSNFRDKKQGETTYENISRQGLFRITTETTSACTLDSTLPEEGCSGQKPFLINNETLNHPMEYTTDVFQVAFAEAEEYSDTQSNTFYPLDIARSEEFYKNQDGATSDPYKRGGFLGFVTSAVDGLTNVLLDVDTFGEANPDEDVLASRGITDEDKREKYVTNIMAGIEQDELLTMPWEDIDPTTLNYYTSGDDEYALDYSDSKKATMYDYCNLILINKMNTNGIMCNLVNIASLNDLLPFVEDESTSTMTSNTILTDTENSLLALNGEIDDANRDTIDSYSNITDLSVVQEILKPVNFLGDTLEGLLFGGEKANTVSPSTEIVYAFDEDKTMTMTVPITNDGTQVDSFASFKLLKLHSIYGSRINSCTVKLEFVLGILDAGEHTYVEDDGYVKPANYHRPSSRTNWDNNDWVNWCRDETADKGLFDYLKEGKLVTGLLKTVVSVLGNIKITQVGYESTRGLVLDLKRVDPDPVSTVNTYKIDVLQMQAI